MRKRYIYSILIMLFLVSVILVGRRVLWPDELIYKGRPITEWMEKTFWGDLPGTSMSHAEWMEAADAAKTALNVG
jgi:hypothetical protein